MSVDEVVVSESAASLDEAHLKDQKEKARRVRKRLHARETFMLPEIWDVVSARIMADAGFDLIGISAASMAWGPGVKRAERLASCGACATAQKIVSDFPVPVNADLEGIAGRSVEEIARSVEAVVSAGCAGVVIGDGGR